MYPNHSNRRCGHKRDLDHERSVTPTGLTDLDKFRMASFRNLALNTFRLAGRANIAHARRDLHDRTDTFAVYGI